MASKILLQAIPTTPPVPPPFPPPSDVVLLLHGNGATGGTSFPDNSFTPATFTANGAITTEPNPNIPPNPGDLNQFSASSIYTPKTGYLTSNVVPPSTRYVMGSGPFTLEAFIYPLSYGNGYGIWFDTRFPAAIQNNGVIFGFNGNKAYAAVGPIFANFFTSTASIQLNKWTHLALVRYGPTGPDNVAIYIDGTRDSLHTSTANISDGTVTIGQDGTRDNSQAFDGYLNEVRLTKGVAIYSGASFTPPSAPFPNAGP